MVEKCLPNLVIAGVVKGGTTSLFSYLSQHSDVCSSSVKETCYFSTYRYGDIDDRYAATQDPFIQYQSYFAQCQNQSIIMEATPGYFEGGKQLATQIKQQLGDSVKILIILREPVERLVSFFKFKKSMLELPEDLAFADYIRQCQAIPQSERGKRENNIYWGIEGGLYANYIDDWFEVFGDSVKIEFFDHLKNNPQALLLDLCHWLKIDTSEVSQLSLTVENKTVQYRYRILQEAALFLNKKAEVFWRKNPGVKKFIRNVYYAVNSGQLADEIPQEMLDDLNLYFYSHNQRLAQKLIARKYHNLPEWLQSNAEM